MPRFETSFVFTNKLRLNYQSSQALSHILDAVADNSVLPSLAEMMMAVEYCFLRSTCRCLNMTAQYLFGAERKIRIAEAGED